MRLTNSFLAYIAMLMLTVLLFFFGNLGTSVNEIRASEIRPSAFPGAVSNSSASITWQQRATDLYY